MNYLSISIQTAVLNVKEGCVNGCVMVQKGILWLGEGVSRTLIYVYSPKGLASLSKVLIASGELASLVDTTARGTLAEGLKHLRFFKDTLYATFWITSTSELIKEGLRAKKVVILTWEDGLKKTIKILNCIGDYFEFFKFLDKNGACSFTPFNEAAKFLNSARISVIPWSWGDCPAFLNPFCERPKDFFIFWSSVIDIGLGIKEGIDWNRRLAVDKKFDWVSLAKRVGSLGKAILITFGNSGLVLAVVDNITQLAAFVKLILEKEKERKGRLVNPPAAAAA